MRNQRIIIFRFFQLLLQPFLTLGGVGNLLIIMTAVDSLLHTGNLFFVHPLDAVQILHTHITDSIRIPAVHINQRLEAVLLAAVKEPINRAFLISFHVILNKVVQKIVSDDLARGVALIAQCRSDKIQVLLQCLLAVSLFQPRAK